MTEKKEEITLSHPYRDKLPGETIKVEPAEARRLIRSGFGLPAKGSSKIPEKPEEK